MVQNPSPIRQEVVNQLLGPVQYPMLRRSLRRLRSTRELDGFLRPVLVPDNHARGVTNWYNNARFQAWVRREFLLRAGEEQQAQRQQKGSFLGMLCVGPIILISTDLYKIDHITPGIYPEPPWVASASLPAFQEVVNWFGLHDWNRKVWGGWPPHMNMKMTTIISAPC